MKIRSLLLIVSLAIGPQLFAGTDVIRECSYGALQVLSVKDHGASVDVAIVFYPPNEDLVGLRAVLDSVDEVCVPIVASFELEIRSKGGVEKYAITNVAPQGVASANSIEYEVRFPIGTQRNGLPNLMAFRIPARFFVRAAANQIVPDEIRITFPVSYYEQGSTGVIARTVSTKWIKLVCDGESITTEPRLWLEDLEKAEPTVSGS
jgi:hypothetical protein